MAHWIKLTYERNVYAIDLDRVGAFWHSSNNRISFTPPGSTVIITITQQANPEIYQKLLSYVESQTEFPFP